MRYNGYNYKEWGENMMMLLTPAAVWLGLVILLLVIELATMGLTTIWFAGGALAAFISTFFGANVIVQCALFLILSFVLLAVTRPLALKYMKPGMTRTNADSLIGRTAVVTKKIDNLAQTGEVMISDVSWTARNREESCVIAEGSKVRICAIEGVKLIVEEIKEEN